MKRSKVMYLVMAIMCVFYAYSTYAAQQIVVVGPPVSGASPLWQSESVKINANFTETYGLINRNFLKMDITEADTTLTGTQILAYKYITNQENTGEADIILPDVSYPIEVVFISEEAQVMEINPPTDEILLLDGAALDANDVVDSPGAVGDKLSAIRHQKADGTWQWSVDAVTGVWLDGDATD